jgi:hypothetical protein
MRRLLLWSTLVAVALAVAAVVAFRDGDASAHVAAKSESGATTPRRRTIVFRAREPFPPKFFDIVPPRGPSPGDEGIEKEFLSVNGRRIGYDLLHFNAIAPTRAGGPDVSPTASSSSATARWRFRGRRRFGTSEWPSSAAPAPTRGAGGQLTILRTLPEEIDVDRLELIWPAM